MRQSRILRLSAAAAALFLGTINAATARAVAIQPNLTNTLAANGLAVNTLGPGVSFAFLGTASANALSEGVYPVTGGDIDFTSLTGTIEHQGSGFSLSNAAALIEIRNPLIDLTNLQLRADVTITPTGGSPTVLDDYHAFDMETCQSAAGVDPCIMSYNDIRLDGWGLRATYDAATDSGSAKDLVDALGLPAGAAASLAADHFAVIRLDVVPVPEPGSGALALLGLAGLAMRRPRR